MQLEMTTGRYILDIFSSDAEMFNINGMKLIDYMKINFLILYDIKVEKDNRLVEDEIEYYNFISKVLDYLNLPRYIELYINDDETLIEPITNIKLFGTYDSVSLLKDNLKKLEQVDNFDYFVRTLNFFCPLPETKIKANISKEEITKELSVSNKKYIKE